MLCLLWVAFSILLLYFLSLYTRPNPESMKPFCCWYYAHRGLHDDRKPENSLSAFQAAVDNGYGAELDVHLLKDGNLAVMHDSDLLRVTGRPGKMEALSTEELDHYFLKGSLDTIPTFCQVLDVFQGKTPLIVELKTWKNNYAELCRAVCNALQDYPGPFCLESFDPRCVLWLKKNRPDLIRGQLAESFTASNFKIPTFLKRFFSINMLNFITKPDFIAYKFSDRKTVSNWICRRIYQIQGVSWTLQNQKDFNAAVREGWIPIFEGFKPEYKQPGKCG